MRCLPLTGLCSLILLLLILASNQQKSPPCPTPTPPDGPCHSTGDGVIAQLNRTICAEYFDVGRSRSTPQKEVHPEYDFVVIGGGTAGAIVASRLSENPTVSVLLLERGGSGSDGTDFPWLGLILNDNKLITRHLETTPQVNACGANGGKCTIYIADVLGGGSTHNYMGWQRGAPEDYDGWSTNGAIGWSYAELLPYFKRIETVDPSLTNSEYRGSSGPTYVTNSYGSSYRFNDLTLRWLVAARQYGFPIGDHNAAYHDVFSPQQSNIDQRGRRASTDNAYLKPILPNRPNFHVLMFANVLKILFETTKNGRKRAIGVEYERGDKIRTVLAKSEVILSAGAINTPKILMLSGIGPSSVLTKFNIPPIVELEGVGVGFQDHPYIDMLYDTDHPLHSRQSLLTKERLEYWKTIGDVAGLGSSMEFGSGFIPFSDVISYPTFLCH